MGNVMHQWRKGVNEMRESVRLSEVFATVQQRKGDRMIKLFMASFFISMLVVTHVLLRTPTRTRCSSRLSTITWSTGSRSVAR